MKILRRYVPRNENTVILSHKAKNLFYVITARISHVLFFDFPTCDFLTRIPRRLR